MMETLDSGFALYRFSWNQGRVLAPSGALAGSRFHSFCSASVARSASAAMVSAGLMQSAHGTMEPSMTTRS